MYNDFLEYLPKNEHTEKIIADIKRVADEYLTQPIQSLNYSKFKYVIDTGTSREIYENDYIEHRRRLNVFLVMSLYEDNDVYISELENILWSICDEFTWCLPAHMHVAKGKKTISDIIAAVDIFAAETVFYLAEAIYLTKNRISDMVYERVVYEINRRAISPFMNDKLRWVKNNWSGVCASSIGTAMIYLGMDKEFSASKAHLSECINDFLSSYEDDGCCKEGALYWTYGFGFFCYYARLVREYTNGEIDYFKLPKVKAIAKFGQNIYFDENDVIPFSDAPHELNYNIGLHTFLAKEYGGTIPSEEYECKFGDDVRYRMCHMVRDLFWYDNCMNNCLLNEKYIYYSDAMWYINKKNTYYFAAKGGNNDEPHNHNDLGGFVLYDNGKYIIDDLGWPMYDRQYFHAGRYEHICASVKGHSVPQFDNKEQVCGAAAYTEMLFVDENEFSLDLSRAYDSLSKIERKFQLFPNLIKIRDEFSDNKCEITERFVTRIMPCLREDGCVEIGNWVIKCNTDCKTVINKCEFNPRNNIVKSAMKDTEVAYLIEFKLINSNKFSEIIIAKEGEV